MREIKFRGKRVGAGEWGYGDLLHDKGMRPHIVPQRQRFDIDDDNCEIYEVDSETVGQFTGLQDKNGVDIYEGDRVRTRTNTPNLVEKQSQWTNAEIIYVACSFFFKEKEKIYDKNIVPCGYPICEIVKFQTTIGLEIEVIGNIHDNPELLK